MDRVKRIQELYRKLNKVRMDIRPFETPQSAQNPKPWGKTDIARYKTLWTRYYKIIIELSKLERGIPKEALTSPNRTMFRG